VTKKILLLALCSLLLTLGFSAQAQQPKKVPRLGWLSHASPNPELLSRIEVFRQGLKALGYEDQKNIAIEYRYTEGKPERLPNLASELARLKVDVIVTHNNQSIRAAQQTTKTIPIVMAVSTEPVANGFVSSLARPGGNITGLADLTVELSGKRLELLKETVPKVSRVALLVGPGASPLLKRETEAAATGLHLVLQPLEVRNVGDLEKAFEAAVRERANALIPLPNPVWALQYRTRLLELAANNRLPAIYHHRDFVDSGGLMAYGTNYDDLFRRAATYVDKILKGAKPSDLPVEQPTKFELIINLKTAKQIGLTIPPNVLVRADRVIR
jgi:putative ABC transport system substrate-binding protein